MTSKNLRQPSRSYQPRKQLCVPYVHALLDIPTEKTSKPFRQDLTMATEEVDPMTRRRRQYLTASVSLAVGATPAGCGTGRSSDEDGDGGTGDAGRDIELKVWNAETNDEAQIAVTEKMIDAFEADNPNGTVKLVTVGWSDIFTKWHTALPSGNAPDATIGSAPFAGLLPGARRPRAAERRRRGDQWRGRLGGHCVSVRRAEQDGGGRLLHPPARSGPASWAT